MTYQLLKEAYLCGTRELMNHHLTNTCGSMRVHISTTPVVIQIPGDLRDSIALSTISLLKMDLTGKSRTEETKIPGHSTTNATLSLLIKLKEILVNADMETITLLILASIIFIWISLKEETPYLNLLVWEIWNQQEISGLVITVLPTNSHSGEENGLITLQWFPLRVPLETSVKTGSLDPIYGMVRELYVNQNLTMVDGLRLPLLKIYKNTQVTLNQPNGRSQLGLMVLESTNIFGWIKDQL